MRRLCLWMCLASLLAGAAVDAQDEIVFAERGGVQLVSVPQPQPPPADGFVATKIVARTLDADHSIVTFENQNLLGDVHHVWQRFTREDGESWFDFETPYVQTIPDVSSVRPELTQQQQAKASALFLLDSHFLITPDMLGGGAGACYCLSESNDESTSAITGGDSESWPEGSSFPTGYGDIRTQTEHDAFFLQREFQRPWIDLWYVVTADQMDSEVFITTGSTWRRDRQFR